MSRYLIGIDLGTTNTVVAYADKESRGEAQEIRTFEIEQLVALGEVAARPALPSARYHPAPGELKDSDIRLPWLEHDPAGIPDAVIGALAQELGAQVPGRLVASAKSWLSHGAVDRLAPILPWGAPQEVPKVSPVDASASYLFHVRTFWNHRLPDHPLERQEVVLTVPASFDEAARALTVEAARRAGIARLRLLEEPQAALYDWLQWHRHRLTEQLAGVRLVLVCDVGGGTTDLTLIRVEVQDGAPRLTRIGVGDHLMLGGDNMDLALAHVAEGRLAASGSRLSAGRLSQLIQQCRRAKERLLAPNPPDSAMVTVLGAGGRVVGGAVSTEFSLEEVRRMICDGFLPVVGPDARPQRMRGGIVEFGLPYAADPGITRHVAAFLARHAQAAREALADRAPPGDALPTPDAVLLNGGVFRSVVLSGRLVEVLSSWRGAPVRLLENEHPDLAVARGAVAYAMARAGAAPRIGGGSARSYFLVLDDRQRRGVCLLPRGTEEGTEIRLTDRTFALRLGQPVRFHLVSSTADAPCRPGELTDVGGEGFVSLPPIATVLGAQPGTREVPVELAATLTEVGTLEVHCVSAEAPAQRWRLEFQLRGAADAPPAGIAAELHPRFGEAAARMVRVFGPPSAQVDPREVKRLRSELERLLGPRDTWDTPLLRELFAVLWSGAARRRRSADHERVWLNLAGFCLRPGFGYPLDDWRVEQLWSLFETGIQYVRESQVWSEWWTLWRRVAGGLDERAQETLLDDIAPYLEPPTGRVVPRRAGGPRKQGYDDMVRLAAALERVPAARKEEVGEWLLERLKRPGENPQTWSAVGRLGARVPFYGSPHNVVPRETATRWLQRLFQLNWKKVAPAPFAAALLARRSGDRARDLDPEVRHEVVACLQSAKAPPSWSRMVQEVVELEEADERRVFGESLPPGLRLIH